MELNDSNFLIYAIKKYKNPQCEGMEDLEEDLKRFKYLKRLFRRYEKNGILSERLIINHLIILYNVFGTNATELLFFKTDPEHFAILKSFLVFLNRVPLQTIGNNPYADIPLDANILEELRKL
jgi:hypothetical protein